MRKIATTHSRTLPRADLPKFAEPDEKDRPREDLRRYERAADQVRRDILELDRSIPGDQDDELLFRSKGPQVELQIPHKLKVAPNRFYVVQQTDEGSLWQSRDSLANEKDMFLKTNAGAGTAFIVIPYKRNPVSGRGAEAPLQPVLDEDEQGDEGAQNEAASGSPPKGKKKKG